MKHYGSNHFESNGYYDQAHLFRDYKAYTGHFTGEIVNAKNILY
jgi:hypothetical protein